ncbi:adhesion G protein-coupled receptor L2-like isoform X2 [Tachypleus tridentatus]|uniref:adhesion G protein-coupled receptor L2-like isoform X2 n=1 Tax=Tachypleus tridentatus TaxID=6853 RepID=UPI003FD4EBD7
MVRKINNVLLIVLLITSLRIPQSYHQANDRINEFNNCCRQADFNNSHMCNGQSCYVFFPELKDWKSALQECRQGLPFYTDGVYLVQLETEVEEQLIKYFVRKLTDETTTIWTSGSKCPHRENGFSSTKFLWIDKNPVPAWIKDKLSSLETNIEPDEGCVYLYMRISENPSQEVIYGFSSESLEYSFICEMVYPDQPSTTSRFSDMETSSQDSITTAKTDKILSSVDSTIKTTMMSYPSTESLSHETTVVTTLFSKHMSSITSTMAHNPPTEPFTYPTSTKKDIFPVYTETSSQGISIPPVSVICSSFSSPCNQHTTTQKFNDVDNFDRSSKIPHSLDYCPGLEVRGIQWPNILNGSECSCPCPGNSIGKATWRCENMKFVTPVPTYSNCKHQWLMILEKQIKNGWNILDISKSLNEGTLEEDIFGGDVATILSIGKKLRVELERNLNEKTNDIKEMLGLVINNIISTYDNLVNEKHDLAWKDLPHHDQVTSASEIMSEVDKLGILLSCQLSPGSRTSIIKQFVALEAFTFPEQKIANVLKFPELSDTQLILPKGLNTSDFPSACSVMTGVGVHYKRLGNYLKPQNDGSNVTYPEWDTSGCRLMWTTTTSTYCACSHLTNFAVLMDFSGVTLKKHNKPLRILSLVCCVSSIVALGLTIAFLVFFRPLRCRRSTITCNVSASLLVTHFFVVVGLDKTEVPVLCAIIAGILHYSILAAFSWMLLEGFHLYQMIVVVFTRVDRLRIYWFYAFGYGVPFVIVLTSSIVHPSGFGTEHNCWLDMKTGMVWSFAGPASVVILVNIIILVVSLRSAASSKLIAEQTSTKKTMNWLKGTFSLMTLLGLTWVVGFFFNTEATVGFAYLFVIMNGLQGVFIFIFNVMMNDKVQNYLVRVYINRSLSQPLFVREYQTRSSVSERSQESTHSRNNKK